MAYKGNLSKKYPNSGQYDEGFGTDVKNHIKVKGANPHETTAEQVGAANKDHVHAEATNEKSGFLTPAMLAILLASVSGERLDEILSSYYDKADIALNFFKKDEVRSLIADVTVIVDEAYNKDSKNAQSGKAVAQAVSQEIAKLIGTSGPALDTIQELAEALGNNPDFVNDMLELIGNKADSNSVYTRDIVDELLRSKANKSEVISSEEAEAMFTRYKTQVIDDVERKIRTSEANISTSLEKHKEEVGIISDAVKNDANEAKDAAVSAENAAESATKSAEEVKTKLNSVYSKDETYSADTINEMFRNASALEFDIRNFIKSTQFLGNLEITRNTIKLQSESFTMFLIGMEGFKTAEFYAKSGSATVEVQGDETEIQIGGGVVDNEQSTLFVDKPFVLKATEDCEIVFVNAGSDFLELKNEAKEVLTPIKLSELNQTGDGIVDGNRITFSLSGEKTLYVSGMVEFEIDTGITHGATNGVGVYVDDVLIKQVSGSDAVIETVKYKGNIESEISISTASYTYVTFLKLNEITYESGRVTAEDFKDFVYMREMLPKFEENLSDVAELKIPANAKYIKKTFSALDDEGRISLDNSSITRSAITFSGTESNPASATFTIPGDIELTIYSDTANSSTHLIVDGEKIATVGTSEEPLYFRGNVKNYLAIVSVVNGEKITFKNGIGFRNASGGILTAEDYGALLDASYRQNEHEKDKNNPHKITAEQIGVFTAEQTEKLVKETVASLVASAPETLNTLKEVATALNNDPSFATTIMQVIGEKANSEDVYSKKDVYNKNETLSKDEIAVELANSLSVTDDGQGNVMLTVS